MFSILLLRSPGPCKLPPPARKPWLPSVHAQNWPTAHPPGNPDGCAALGLVSAPFRAEPGLWSAAVGAGAGYLTVQVIFVWGYERLTGHRGMGEGDSKLLMMIGAFLGWRGALFSVVAGSLQGLIFAAFALVTGHKLTPDIEERVIDGEVIEAPEQSEASRVGLLKLPFGPFLALGALEYLLAGDAIISWYFGLLQR